MHLRRTSRMLPCFMSTSAGLDRYCAYFAHTSQLLQHLEAVQVYG